MAQREIFGYYGCYLQKESVHWVITYPDEWTEAQFDEAICDQLYEMSYEVTQSFVGLHGFCDFYDEEMSEEEESERIHEEIEQAADFHWEDWNEEEHRGEFHDDEVAQTIELP